MVTKQEALAIVNAGGQRLQELSLENRNDRDIVLAAVSQNGYALQFAPAELKNDKDIVLAAVSKHGYALQCAPAELQNDRDIVLAAVSQDGRALQFAPTEFRNNREIVLAAVSQSGYALQRASAELQNDRGIVLAAVSEYGGALQSASAELKNDRGIVLAAVSQNGKSLQYASSELKNDRGIVLAAVPKHDCALNYLQTIYSQRIEILHHISEQLKESYFYNYLQLIAVESDIGEFNQYISSRLQIQTEPITPFLDIIKSCIEESDIERLLWLLQHYAQNITYSESEAKFMYQESSDISSAWNGYHLAILTAIELNQPEIIQHFIQAANTARANFTLS